MISFLNIIVTDGVLSKRDATLHLQLLKIWFWSVVALSLVIFDDFFFGKNWNTGT